MHTCRWEWWNLWFEAGLLLALFITCFLEQAFKRGRMCFLAFFVLATQGLMWSAHNFLTALELTVSGLNTRDLGQDAINAGEQERDCAGLVGIVGCSSRTVVLHSKQKFFCGRHVNCNRPIHPNVTVCMCMWGRLWCNSQLSCSTTNQTDGCAGCSMRAMFLETNHLP